MLFVKRKENGRFEVVGSRGCPNCSESHIFTYEDSMAWFMRVESFDTKEVLVSFCPACGIKLPDLSKATVEVKFNG